MPYLAAIILAHCRIISTISIQIIARIVAICGKVASFIRIDEPTYLRIVISALEVVQAGLLTPLEAKRTKMEYF